MERFSKFTPNKKIQIEFGGFFFKLAWKETFSGGEKF